MSFDVLHCTHELYFTPRKQTMNTSESQCCEMQLSKFIFTFQLILNLRNL